MKYLILLILLFNFFSPTLAQINLVPNPSFEDTVYCPFGLDQMSASTGWSSFRNSPDYFNGCNTFNGIGTPNTSFGFQSAHSGQAFIGLITYRKYNSSSGYNYREFAGTTLNTNLQIGAKYYFSLYVVAAERISGFLSNNIGLRFFTLSFSNSNPAPIDNFSHVKIDSILSDSLNWYKISGSFIADSNYSHVCIGNFYDYQSTDTISFSSLPDYAYYFIDDVCVTTDSLYNETWTGLFDIEQNEVQIWPNPVQDYFHYKSNQLIDEISICDSRGKLIRNESVDSMEGRINLGVLSEGIYFASFRKEKTISVYKLLKL